MAGTPAWPGPVVQRVSWDHLVHDFTELGELTSAAVCTHKAATDSLETPPEGARRCSACQMIRDAQMEVRRQKADEWLHAEEGNG